MILYPLEQVFPEEENRTKRKNGDIFKKSSMTSFH